MNWKNWQKNLKSVLSSTGIGYDALNASPLGGSVKYADGDGVLCPVGTHNHFIMVYGDTDKTAYIDDSYTNADKVYCKERVSNLVGCSITYNIKSDMNVAQFLKDNDLKWVRNQNTGAFGRIMQGKLMIVDTKDRGVLIVLDEMVRTNGRQMTQPEWDAIKEAEKMENF